MGGQGHDLTKLVAICLEVTSSDSFESVGKILGDLNSVENNVLLDELHVVDWALGNLDDVVESGPVGTLGVNSLANWDGLLELLNEGNSSDNSWDGFLDILVFPGLLEHLDSLVEDESSLISLIDADEEVGEVEVSNIGGLKESLSELSGSVGIWLVLADELLLKLELGGHLEDLTHLETIGLEVLGLVSLNSLIQVRDEAESINQNVLLHGLEIIRWVLSNLG